MLKTSVDKAFEGLRIDKFLCQKFDISFALAQKLIRGKKVKINNVKCEAAFKIKALDQIEIFANLQNRDIKLKQKAKISPEKIKQFLASIIYQDDNIIAINKDSGLATQGGSGIAISVDDFLPYLKLENAIENPQLVHRLDKDTSGILLIAQNKKTAEFLTKSFKEKTIRKTYLALVCGVVKKESGEINISLLKKFVGKSEKVYPDFQNGKSAITNFKLLKKFKDYSLLELNPITGRTHQIRVHCKEIGHPIINDIKYGGPSAKKDIFNRLCLHAFQIELENYCGKKLIIKTSLPDFAKKTFVNSSN